MGTALQERSGVDELIPGEIEAYLSSRDRYLGAVIGGQSERWPSHPTEEPIWGLVRIVIAQQISTQVACAVADKLKSSFPTIDSSARPDIPSVAALRSFGIPERRATTCVDILNKSDRILEVVNRGTPWETALEGIKGIGPWTIATFRIMVLRHPDVLPLGDVGLERAVRKAYGEHATASDVSEKWRPYRSVACWYLWRTLGNKQLG